MLTSPSRLVSRASNKILSKVGKYLNRDLLTGIALFPSSTLEKIGSQYGGWIVPTDLLTPDSICYCVGVGEDITFDLGLIDRFHCRVFAYDPTPRAAQHVKLYSTQYPAYRFDGVGVWDTNASVKFYAPSNPANVSHSALNLQKTDSYFEAQCKTLKTLMQENSHHRLDLLKLDVEGAEYQVVDSLIADKLDIHILCIEYDEAYNPLDYNYKQRIQASVSRLLHYGYTMTAVDARGNYTFIKKPAPATGALWGRV